MSSAPVSQPLLVPKKSFLKKKNMLIILGIVIILLVCGGGLYYWKYMRQTEGYQETTRNTVGEFKLYFASWCGWSKKFSTDKTGKDDEGEWEKLVKSEKRVTFTKYICDGANKDECDKANIQGFPSMKFQKNGEETDIEYDGERTAQAISNWITQKLE